MNKMILVLLFSLIASSAHAQVRQHKFDLSWQDNSTTESGFNIYLKQTDGTYAQVGRVTADVTTFSYLATGVEGSTWTFAVRAYNSNIESANSNDASGTIPVTLPTPTADLSGSITSAKLVTLNWSDNADNELGRRIYRDNVEVAQVGANVVTWSETVTGGGGTVYSYQVAPYNMAGTSAKSNTLQLQVPSVPSSPAAPSVTVVVRNKNQCSFTLTGTPPIGGGWTVQFRYGTAGGVSGGTSFGASDSTSPYTVSANLKSGTYDFWGRWTKIGQAALDSAHAAGVCP
jgi:hypothetical protein